MQTVLVSVREHETYRMDLRTVHNETVAQKRRRRNCRQPVQGRACACDVTRRSGNEQRNNDLAVHFSLLRKQVQAHRLNEAASHTFKSGDRPVPFRGMTRPPWCEWCDLLCPRRVNSVEMHIHMHMYPTRRLQSPGQQVEWRPRF